MVASRWKLLTVIIVNMVVINVLIYKLYQYDRLLSVRNPQLAAVFNNQSESRNKRTQITLRVDILDMYRLDISCTYVIRDLESKVDEKYKNTKRKCSAASAYESKYKESDVAIEASSLNQVYKPVYEYNDKLNEMVVANGVRAGGYWSPKISDTSTCKNDDVEFIVFVVPYMDRAENLRLFLVNMHNYLILNNRNPFTYRIVVAEQHESNDKFNKGQLFNAGVKYVLETYENVDCIVLHDVDLIPLVVDGSLDYRCRVMPWHLSRRVKMLATSKSRYYNQFLTGGVLSLRPDHFLVANGFSNSFYGWGGEDDDWTLRMFNKKLCLMRPDTNETLFTMLAHRRSQENKRRFNILTSAFDRQNVDGFSTIKLYTNIKKVSEHPLYTNLLISVSSSI